MKPLVIYHADCVDGFTAAWVAWLKYGDSAHYVPARYGDDPPDTADRDVLIVDFSYPRAVLLGMRLRQRLNSEEERSFRVLDHHKTAQSELAGLPFCTFDMERSGAGLAWDELRGGPRPAIIDYVEDRDLWRWKLPNSREVSAYLSTIDREFRAWHQLASELDVHFSEIVPRGESVLRAQERYVQESRPRARRVEINGYVVPCVNTTYAHSELIGALAEGHPFAVGWFQREDGMFVYSLRSRGAGGADVSVIAKLRGGGGHRNAAGFTSEVLL